MVFETSDERRQALIDLLSLPDTPDIKRGHRQTVEGRADRFGLVQHLTATFVQLHRIEVEDRAL